MVNALPSQPEICGKVVISGGGGTDPRKVCVGDLRAEKLKLYLYKFAKKWGLFYILSAKEWGLFSILL